MRWSVLSPERSFLHPFFFLLSCSSLLSLYFCFFVSSQYSFPYRSFVICCDLIQFVCLKQANPCMHKIRPNLRHGKLLCRGHRATPVAVLALAWSRRLDDAIVRMAHSNPRTHISRENASPATRCVSLRSPLDGSTVNTRNSRSSSRGAAVSEEAAEGFGSRARDCARRGGMLAPRRTPSKTDAVTLPPFGLQ